MFIIEGLIVSCLGGSVKVDANYHEKTVVAAAVAYLLLPTSISTALYLTPEEKESALLRLQGKTQSTASDRFKYAEPQRPGWVVVGTGADSTVLSSSGKRSSSGPRSAGAC
jgi:hypothetical protein